MLFSDAIRRLLPVLYKVEKREEENKVRLLNQKRSQTQLSKEKKALMGKTEELLLVSDRDRDAIIENTKKIDVLKVEARKLQKKKKNLKPGQKLIFNSKRTPLT